SQPPYNQPSADHLFDRAVRLPDPQQEGKTMVRAMSLFNQLLKHFPVLEFAALVKKHDAERAAKGFSCRAQLVAMLFCQVRQPWPYPVQSIGFKDYNPESAF